MMEGSYSDCRMRGGMDGCSMELNRRCLGVKEGVVGLVVVGGL